MTEHRRNNGSSVDATVLRAIRTDERAALPEEAFKRMISVERKRTERSSVPFLLMLLATGEYHSEEKSHLLLVKVISALSTSTRETDVIGWYQQHRCIGVLFTDLIDVDQKATLPTMLGRIGSILRDRLSQEQFNQISISFHVYPDQWDQDGSQRPSNPILYPELPKVDNLSKLFSLTKRAMDIAGSVFLLLLGSPLFVIVALAVKMSSQGPILYRQQRVGQYGRLFTFLKFRSMYIGNDFTIHRNYVTQLIAGQAERHPVNAGRNARGVYKLTRDNRITAVGAFLRRTSLDELPQLFNVLKGEMSLVGPRPAIPYEVAAYRTWHRSRVLEVKPGITGLWQVNGRCQVGFDDMVRLDIRYAREWSPWLDLKILLRTPRAVIQGAGAH